MKILPYCDDEHYCWPDLYGLRSLVLGLVLVALAGGGENVKSKRRRPHLRVLKRGGRYSCGEANEDAQRRRRFRQGTLRR